MLVILSIIYDFTKQYSLFSLLHGSNVFSNETCLQYLFSPWKSNYVCDFITFMPMTHTSINSVLNSLLSSRLKSIFKCLLVISTQMFHKPFLCMSKIKLSTTYPLLPFLANVPTPTQARNLEFISFIHLVTKSYFLLYNNLIILSPFNKYLGFPNFLK